MSTTPFAPDAEAAFETDPVDDPICAEAAEIIESDMCGVLRRSLRWAAYLDEAPERDRLEDDVLQRLCGVWSFYAELKPSRQMVSALVPLIREYPPELVERAVEIVAPRVESGYLGDGWPAYLSGVCRNLAVRERD